MADELFRRILLVGFMGSGKTAVGRELASRLAWDFYDFDEVVREEVGIPIDAIFREQGEAAFRRLEEEVGERLLRRERAILASGGGWAATPGRLEGVPPGTFSVWLKVSPETALRRIQREASQEVEPAVRPLLDVADPLAEARRILRMRKAFYERASLTLDGESDDPSGLAGSIIRFMKTHSHL